MKNKRKRMDLFQFHLWHRLNRRIQIHKGGEENQSKAERKMRGGLMADIPGLENNVFILVFF
jgi:hypothetical protein